MSLLRKPDPVTDGDFEDGSDTILWNPRLTSTRWRIEALLALFGCNTVIGAVGWLAAMVLSIDLATGVGAAVLIGGGVAVALCGVFMAVVNFACFAEDHNHRRGARCRLERRPGEFFFRTRDFADLDGAADRATMLIDLIAEIHRTPARCWLDPALPGQVHQLVWEALCCLNRTRATREHAAQLTTAPGETALATAIGEFDTAIDGLIVHLQGCVTLTRAWEMKLRHSGLVTETQTVLQDLQAIPILPITTAAEELPRSVFAYLTAARDLTGAGLFPWERAAAAQT